jgi:hypothetical protein
VHRCQEFSFCLFRLLFSFISAIIHPLLLFCGVCVCADCGLLSSTFVVAVPAAGTPSCGTRHPYGRVFHSLLLAFLYPLLLFFFFSFLFFFIFFVLSILFFF